MTPLSTDEAREVQLGVLDAVAAYCEEAGLRWYLCAGSLLGAQRHQGYVPWDDDVDLMLPRADYERFVRDFPDSERYAVHAAGRAHAEALPFAKVCDERTRLEVESEVAGERGVFVDVFPLDGWRGGAVGVVQRVLLRVLLELMLVKSRSRERSRGAGKALVLRAGKALLGPVPACRIGAGLTRVARWGALGSCAEGGVIVWGYQERVPAAAYGAPGTASFEGRTVPVPADPDTVLTRLYGDWRTPPPAAEQHTHHRFTAYWRD